MTEQYQGLCIGGPRDGETYTSTRGPEFVAHIPGPIPLEPRFAVEAPTSEPVTARMIYRHIWQWTVDDVHGKVQFGFWVPAEHFPVAQWYIATQLVEAYRHMTGSLWK